MEMATHSSVLAWRIPGMGEPGGLPSMGSHRVRHDWSDLAAAAAAIWEREILALARWILYKDTQQFPMKRMSEKFLCDIGQGEGESSIWKTTQILLPIKVLILRGKNFHKGKFLNLSALWKCDSVSVLISPKEGTFNRRKGFHFLQKVDVKGNRDQGIKTCTCGRAAEILVKNYTPEKQSIKRQRQNHGIIDHSFLLLMTIPWASRIITKNCS